MSHNQQHKRAQAVVHGLPGVNAVLLVLMLALLWPQSGKPGKPEKVYVEFR